MMASRVCPACGAMDPLKAGDDVWPLGWSCPACGHAVPQVDGILMFAPALADTVSGFDPADFVGLAAVEREHFWFVPRNRLIVSLVARYFPDATSLLEIGCGTGMVLSGVAAMKPWRRLVGSELHPSGLVEARRRLGDKAGFVQMDALRIPARDAFDVVGAFDVVEHIEDDEAVLAAMRDAAAPGGGLILTVPQHPFLWSDFDTKSSHVRRYRRGELEGKLRNAGLDVVFSTSYTVLLFPAMVASRLLRGGRESRGGQPATDTKASAGVEFHLPGWLNAIARSLLQAEVTMTLAGLRFPAGGSRVVVAAKR